MSEPIAHTAHHDAPLSAAKSPRGDALNDEHLDGQEDDVLVGRSTIINRPAQQLYDFWRDFANLPVFMHNLKSVRVIDNDRSHWTVEAPAGQTVEWDSIVTADEPGRLIAWKSDAGASVRNSGKVEFREASNGRGTIVSVTLTYDPPGGSVGKLLAKLSQKEPKIQARQDLRRFKQLMETGEIATAQPPHAAPRA